MNQGPSFYTPLDEDRDEIRLLSIQPQQESGLIICHLEKASLKAFSNSYRDFLSTLSSTGKSKRGVLVDWIDSRCQGGYTTSASSAQNSDQIPSQHYHRFIWGDFAALSYVWGEEHGIGKILVNGQEMQVTRNLEVALHHLSSESKFAAEYKLWIDAICINQSDLEERGRQITRMRNIYGNAWSVIAWLGEEKLDSSRAIGLVKQLADANANGYAQELESRLRNNPDCMGVGVWLALQQFMLRPYWTRMWIIQELVLGGYTTAIQAGSHSIDWSTFCKGICVLFQHLWIVKDTLLARDIERSSLDIDNRWSTWSLHHVNKDLWTLTQHKELGGHPLGLGRLLETANSADCTDVRDKVYGLIGMIDPAVVQQLSPNYKAMPSDIFAEVTRAFITTYGNLEPLRECNPWGKAQSPSWAADWTWDGRIRYSRPEATLWGPFFTENSVKEAQTVSVYKASGDVSPQFSFSSDNLHLSCRGVTIDHIDGLSARGNGYFHWEEESIIQPSCKILAYGNNNINKRALCHTLIMNRVADGIKADDTHTAIFSLPSTFASAFPQFLKRNWNWLADQNGYYFRWERWRHANKSFLVGGRRLDEYFVDEIPSDASERTYAEVYACFDRTCKARRFMSTAKGYLGWVPDNIYGNATDQVRCGDIIAILFGCSTPVLLRPVGNKFIILGEVYLHGFMDGEAVASICLDRAQGQDFTLS